ncbi:hypothetical protein ZB78_20160 [Salmonella enterica subsp. enterica serovar Typhimurium]|nr:hypothetical protein [Salmonella enterica subsp. enterica serovar Typhimurium]
MTAWAAGLQLSIRKQNRSIIPVFNALSVPMEFKSPEPQNKRKPGEGYRYCGAVHDFRVPALSDADVQRW